MTLTTPGCQVSESLPVDAGRVLEAALGVPVRVDVVWDPPWTPDRIDPAAAAASGCGAEGRRTVARRLGDRRRLAVCPTPARRVGASWSRVAGAGPAGLGERDSGLLALASFRRHAPQWLLTYRTRSQTLLEGPPRLGDLAARAGARGRSWTEYGIAELIEHLVATHHAYLVSEVPRLVELGARRCLGGARVRCMRRDHVATESLLDELGRLTDNFAVLAGTSPECRAFLVGLAGFVADTRLHIHKEEGVLFPALLAGVAAGTPAGECAGAASFG